MSVTSANYRYFRKIRRTVERKPNEAALSRQIE
jgi:hypothetical protein